MLSIFTESVLLWKIAVLLHKSYIWKKILFLRYRPKCFQSVRLQDFYIISPEQTDDTASFLACWYKFTKIKNWLKSFEVGMVKNGCVQLSYGTLKLIVSEEWIDGINCFFACWYRFTKFNRWSKVYWVDMVKNVYG